MANIYITVFIEVFCLVYIPFILGMEIAFRSTESKYKLIKGKWKFVGDLLEDLNEVTSLGRKITQKAGALLDSGPAQAGLAVQVNDSENQWIVNARKFVSSVESFQRLRKRKENPMWYLIIWADLFPMIDVFLQMRWAVGFLEKKKLCASICRSLEHTRSKVRSLQDRCYVDESKHQSVKYKASPDGLRADVLISSLSNLDPNTDGEGIVIMHLQIVHAFMEDLHQLKLLSAREVSWARKANKTLDKAKDAIATIIKRGENQRRWFSAVTNWGEKEKLKADIVYIRSRVPDLLETKERYGIKFIRRGALKSAPRSPQQQTLQNHTPDPDTDLSSYVTSIHNWLNQLPAREAKKLEREISLLRDELGHMHRLLKHTNAALYASKVRNACLEQLKKMAAEAKQYSETQMEFSENSKHVSDNKRIIVLLRRFSQAYSIEKEEPCYAVGLEEDTHKLVIRLTDPGREIISIGGMKGIGKTTLANKVYHHGTIASHFKLRRWVPLPHQVQEEVVLRRLGKSEEKQSGKDWIKNVHDDLLKKEKYLLLLDNVSSHEVLDDLKQAILPEMADGSKIVVTTNQLAGADQNSTHYTLRLRTQKESWEFFTQMVHISHKEEAIAKKLVARTGGLPLVILRLGYLLSTKKVTSEIDEHYSSLFEHILQGHNRKPWSDTLEMNRNDLENGYFELFPGDFEIPARRLVALWVAKELFETENLANKHLLELIDRNMIQVVREKRNGDVKTCCLPPALRELWMQDKGEKISSITYSWSQSTSSEQQLVSYHCDRNDATFSRIHGLNMNSSNGKHPRSVLFFDTREGNKPGEEIGEFVQRCIACGFFQKLLVLDLERVFKPQLPASIEKLEHLTYLGLRRTCLAEIPSSIGNLVKLRTLDLRHTNLVVLPKSIWNLKELKHIYFNKNCRIKARSLPTSISMRNLQTLSGVFVDKASVVKNRLDKLIKLRKLKLTFNLAVQDQEVLENWIVHLTELESLKMVSTDENFFPRVLKLGSLSNLRNLSSLYLFGRLQIPSITHSLPESLTHLTLSASGIVDDPMPKLGMLPNLKSLSLNSGSYQGTEMVCSTDHFQELVVLRLWNLDNLETIDVQERAMPNLRELEIRSCIKFKITSDGLKDLKFLQEIKLGNMPNDRTADIEKDFAEAMAKSRGKVHLPAIKIDYW